MVPRRRLRHARAVQVTVAVLACAFVIGAPAGRAAASTPFKPNGVVVTAGFRSIHVSWNRVVDDGSYFPIDNYMVTVIPQDGTGIVTRTTASGSLTVSGLKPGVSHYVYVAAHNSQGWGHISDGQYATPIGPPDRPKTPTGTVSGIDRVTITWSKPYDGGSTITGYQLNVNGSSRDLPLNVTSLDVTGKAGTKMQFLVRAKSAFGGWGPWSAIGRTTVHGRPETPVDLSVTAVAGGISAHWKKPSDGTDGGRKVSKYTVRVLQHGNDLRRSTTGDHETILGLDATHEALVSLTITTYDPLDGLGFLDHVADQAHTLTPLPITDSDHSSEASTPPSTADTTPSPSTTTEVTATDAGVVAQSATTRTDDHDGETLPLIAIAGATGLALLAAATWSWRHLHSHRKGSP